MLEYWVGWQNWGQDQGLVQVRRVSALCSEAVSLSFPAACTRPCLGKCVVRGEWGPFAEVSSEHSTGPKTRDKEPHPEMPGLPWAIPDWATAMLVKARMLALTGQVGSTKWQCMLSTLPSYEATISRASVVTLACLPVLQSTVCSSLYHHIPFAVAPGLGGMWPLHLCAQYLLSSNSSHHRLCTFLGGWNVASWQGLMALCVCSWLPLQPILAPHPSPTHQVRTPVLITRVPPQSSAYCCCLQLRKQHCHPGRCQASHPGVILLSLLASICFAPPETTWVELLQFTGDFTALPWALSYWSLSFPATLSNPFFTTGLIFLGKPVSPCWTPFTT